MIAVNRINMVDWTSRSYHSLETQKIRAIAVQLDVLVAQAAEKVLQGQSIGNKCHSEKKQHRMDAAVQ